jgi:hypothetical protein
MSHNGSHMMLPRWDADSRQRSSSIRESADCKSGITRTSYKFATDDCVFIHTNTPDQSRVASNLRQVTPTNEEALVLGVENEVPGSSRIEILKRSGRLDARTHLEHTAGWTATS